MTNLSSETEIISYKTNINSEEEYKNYKVIVNTNENEYSSYKTYVKK